MSKPRMSTLTMCTFLYANYNWKKLTYRKKSSSSSESSSKRFLCQKNEKDMSFLMQKNYETSGKRKETSSWLLTFSRPASRKREGQIADASLAAGTYGTRSADLPEEMLSVPEYVAGVAVMVAISLPCILSMGSRQLWSSMYPRRSKGRHQSWDKGSSRYLVQKQPTTR